jgi:hypothetical protein
MLVYSPTGWEIEKDRARDMIMLLLDKVQDSGDSKYIPILKAWKKIDYRKVRTRIDSVTRALKSNEES